MNIICPICKCSNIELLEDILKGSMFLKKYMIRDCKQSDKELNVEQYYSIFEIPEK